MWTSWYWFSSPFFLNLSNLRSISATGWQLNPSNIHIVSYSLMSSGAAYFMVLPALGKPL